MSAPHRIRLRGPWDVVGLDPQRPTIRMTLPCTWRAGGWLGFAGRVLHVRSFGRPRLRDSNERIWLVIDSVTGLGKVKLNAQELGPIVGSFRHDVTELLQERNRLEIEVTADNDEGGVTGEVALEIRPAC